jgi:tRNA threonylcarbamoyladenosine biosynthesis protein TsaE
VSNESVTVVSDSPETTKRIAACIAEHARPGTVIALHGDLGAGKTCFVQGLARVLADESDVHSPTFTIVNEYGDGPAIYHIDLYRLEDEAAIKDLALEDIFDGDAIVAVEWAERAASLLPPDRVEVSLEHQGDERKIAIRSDARLSTGWETAVRSL